jgi:hypothetical protein
MRVRRALGTFGRRRFGLLLGAASTWSETSALRFLARDLPLRNMLTVGAEESKIFWPRLPWTGLVIGMMERRSRLACLSNARFGCAYCCCRQARNVPCPLPALHPPVLALQQTDSPQSLPTDHALLTRFCPGGGPPNLSLSYPLAPSAQLAGVHGHFHSRPPPAGESLRRPSDAL